MFYSLFVQGWIDICYPDYNNPYDKIFHNKLAFQKVSNGDLFAIDLEEESYGKIVYLSHDGSCENAKKWLEILFKCN